MSKIDESCLYAKSHEWVRVEGDIATCGVSYYAQEQLSDVVYVELPEVGESFAQGDAYGVVESVKAASDCYLPVSGEIIEVNNELVETPETVNSDPYGKGWFVKIKVADKTELSSLMSPSAYQTFAESEG